MREDFANMYGKQNNIGVQTSQKAYNRYEYSGVHKARQQGTAYSDPHSVNHSMNAYQNKSFEQQRLADSIDQSVMLSPPYEEEQEEDNDSIVNHLNNPTEKDIVNSLQAIWSISEWPETRCKLMLERGIKLYQFERIDTNDLVKIYDFFNANSFCGMHKVVCLSYYILTIESFSRRPAKEEVMSRMAAALLSGVIALQNLADPRSRLAKSLEDLTTKIKYSWLKKLKSRLYICMNCCNALCDIFQRAQQVC